MEQMELNNGLTEKSFVFYESLYKNTKVIKDEKLRCRILCFIIEYGLYGTLLDMSDIEDPNGFLAAALVSFKNDMDIYKAEMERISKRKNKGNKEIK